MNRRSKPVAQKELEEQIGRALCSRAESIQVTSRRYRRMRRSVHRKIEEESGMKKWNMKRVFYMVAAAAICTGYHNSGCSREGAYTSAEAAIWMILPMINWERMETKLGYTTNALEPFSNGYRFDMGMPIHQDAMDQDGNVIKSTEGFSLNYKRTETRMCSLQSRAQACMMRKDSRIRPLTITEFTLNYTRDQYRFVPRIIRFPMRRRQRKQQENSISLMEAIRYRIRLPRACSGRMGRRFTS